jgi:hypothetical protein
MTPHNPEEPMGPTTLIPGNATTMALTAPERVQRGAAFEVRATRDGLPEGDAIARLVLGGPGLRAPEPHRIEVPDPSEPNGWRVVALSYRPGSAPTPAAAAALLVPVRQGTIEDAHRLLFELAESLILFHERDTHQGRGLD